MITLFNSSDQIPEGLYIDLCNKLKSTFELIDKPIEEKFHLEENCFVEGEFIIRSSTQLQMSLERLNELRIESLNINLTHSDDFLPHEISRLETLKWLDLQENNLIKLPESLGMLTMLQTLYLSKNDLSYKFSIPTSISNLKNLRELTMFDCKLTTINKLPFESLKNLEHLNLHNNKLKTLPLSMKNLHKLQELCVGKNQLKNIDKVLKGLKTLRLLDVSNNNFDVVPKVSSNCLVNIYFYILMSLY